MPQDLYKREGGKVFEVWHPDGTPFSDADYRMAGMPVPTPENRAHWAEIRRWIAEVKARHFG